MRRRLIVAALLLGTALVLLWLLLPARSEEAASRPGPRLDARRSPSSGRAPPPPGAHPSGLPPDTAPVAAADGVLALEVLAHERPVPGAQVRLSARSPRDPNLGRSTWTLMGTGVTDARGQVQLAAPPGTYVVTVHASGHAARVHHVTRPQGEAVTSLRLVLEPGQVLTGRTVLKGGQGEPLPLVQLFFTFVPQELEPGKLFDLPPEERESVMSDARGLFRVEGLAAGTYLVEAEAPGHAPAWMHPVVVPAEQPLEVALSAAGVLEGFVVDASGAAAEGAEVQVSGVSPQSTRTGPGGGFSVEVEPGAYSVSARRGEETATLGHPVVLSAGRTQTGLRLQLGPGGALEGRVRQRGGEPVVGARVEVSPHGENGEFGREATDAEGHFRVGALPAGSYDLVVTRAGFSPAMRRGMTLASGETFSLDLELTPLGAVEGWVRDTKGQPVEGALVLAPNPSTQEVLESESHETRSDASGHYRIEGLHVGDQTLTARRPGATQGIRSLVEVGLEGAAQLDFTLGETGRVEGVVHAVRGSLPTGELEVYALRARGPAESMEQRRALVSARGDFHLELPAGFYTLLLASQDGASSAETEHVGVVEGETTRVELRWEAPSAALVVEGTVNEPDGAPSPGAHVVLLRENSKYLLQEGYTDERGHFSLRLRPEEDPEETTDHWKIDAFQGGRGGTVVGVKPGERSVRVTLRAPASLRGRVTRAKGSVRGFTLALLREAEEGSTPDRGPWQFSGERFELPQVLAEPQWIVVTTPDGARGTERVIPASGQPTEVNIRVVAPATLRGRAVDADTREPVPRLIVSLPETSMSGQEQLPDGSFIVRGIPPGEHTLQLHALQVTASGEGRSVEWKRTVKLSEDETLDLGDIPIRMLPPGDP